MLTSTNIGLDQILLKGGYALTAYDFDVHLLIKRRCGWTRAACRSHLFKFDVPAVFIGIIGGTPVKRIPAGLF